MNKIIYGLGNVSPKSNRLYTSLVPVLFSLGILYTALQARPDLPDSIHTSEKQNIFITDEKDPQSNIRGEVLDSNFYPVPGARVYLISKQDTIVSGYCDSNGFFHFKSESVENYRLYSIVKPDTLIVDFEMNSQVDTFISLVQLPHKSNLISIRSTALAQKKQKRRAYSKKAIRASSNIVRRPSMYRSPTPSEPEVSVDEYSFISPNQFIETNKQNVSTFSIDVDQASYTTTRKLINEGKLPQPETVRIEEFINYFQYKYIHTHVDTPIVAYTETAVCPWNEKNKLVHIGVQSSEPQELIKQAHNLVFLIDVSGSMADENKLPLVKKSMRILLDKLKPDDQISIVVYAGSVGLILPTTKCIFKDRILSALNRLNAGGSTTGGEGIELAYKTAEESFLQDGNNRIILATDGDFNVGISSQDELKKLIEKKRETGVYLSVCGYGMGNYKDNRLETLADAGNGNYYYIDSEKEAVRTFGQGTNSLLTTLVRDVKIQVEFNPQVVQSYRLIGYENRVLNQEDFSNDKVDAGEMGVGQTVTAIYEIVLHEQNQSSDLGNNSNNQGAELLSLNIRYKDGKDAKSKLYVRKVYPAYNGYMDASENLRVSSSVCMFGMLLSDSKFKGNSSIALAETILNSTYVSKSDQDIIELIALMQKAEALFKK